MKLSFFLNLRNLITGLNEYSLFRRKNNNPLTLKRAKSFVEINMIMLVPKCKLSI